jgi:glycosyltransferase involved in cell wall biosynthesis
VRGITLIGDFMHGASNSKTNRDFAYALKKAGIPYQTFSVDRQKTVPENDYRDVLTPESEFRLHKYTHIIEMFRSPLPRELVENRARIAFWEGEYGILDVWPFLAGEDPVIGMSDFNVEYFKRDLVAPVFKILYPLRKIDVDLPSCEYIRSRYGIGRDGFMVLFTFDFGSFKRKNPLAAMAAFAKAFPTESDVRLVFKTMGAKSHRSEKELLEQEAVKLGIEKRFTIITEYLSHSELYGLTAACDVYISLHKGEGFGIGMAEAMLMGKPVIATNWSANTEFCKQGCSFPVDYKLVPVLPNEYFPSMKEWAEADVDDAAKWLRLCYDDPALRKEVGLKGKAFVEEHFSVENFKKSV